MILILPACSPCYLGREVCGVDEFVMDSYQVQEGKVAILSLQGKETQPLKEALLERTSYQNGFVELAGLVEEHEVPVDGSIGLFSVLAKARISSEANLFKSYVSRQGERLPVDFYRLLVEGDMSQNILMQASDKVYVADPYSAHITLLGEVALEQRIPVPSGFLSLREAIAQAGGIRFTGDTSYIQVIRGDSPEPKIYRLNWEHILHLPEKSLLLIPGDIVYVSSTPIAEWHRFLSQLVPSFFSGEARTKP
ncbi:MAG: hypothetical protein AAGI90_05575 [Chlamydiota bacterium]